MVDRSFHMHCDSILLFGIILLGLKLSEFIDISKASISHTELVNCVKKSHLPINENLTFMKISIHASLVLVQGTLFFFNLQFFGVVKVIKRQESPKLISYLIYRY